MSVTISCNLSTGVILGVDSAVTVPAQQGRIAKVYENAEKLFQLGDRPIGVAIFGLGQLGSRSISSYIREFEVTDPDKVVNAENNLKEVVESLRKFFIQEYNHIIVPEFEKARNMKFGEIPINEIPAFGLVVGGFSSNAYLSEVWQIFIPDHSLPGSSTLSRDQGNFGTNWFALFEPIRRYIKGYDKDLLNELMDQIKKLKGSDLSDSEKQQIQQIINKHEYQIPFVAMPMKEGIAHVRFLVELVINHYRFTAGAPVVGGQAKIGYVKNSEDKFNIIET